MGSVVGQQEKLYTSVLSNSLPNNSHFYNSIEKETKNDNQFDMRLSYYSYIYNCNKTTFFLDSIIMSSMLFVQPIKYIL